MISLCIFKWYSLYFTFLLTFSIMFYTLTGWSVLDYKALKHWQAFVEFML